MRNELHFRSVSEIKHNDIAYEGRLDVFHFKLIAKHVYGNILVTDLQTNRAVEANTFGKINVVSLYLVQ